MASSQALVLMKHLAEAAQNRQASSDGKGQILEQIQKVKFLARASSPQKEKLKEELERLEQQLVHMLSPGSQLIKKEAGEFIPLKDELQQLRMRLALSSSSDLQKSLNRILFLIGDLGARMESYMTIKDERERRIEKIEKKIREQIDCNFEEIFRIEESISGMEERYSEIKKDTKIDKKRLSDIEAQISELRKKLMEKRTKLLGEQEEEGANNNDPYPQNAQPVQAQRKITFPQKKSSSQENGGITHHILFPENLPSGSEAAFPLFREEDGPSAEVKEPDESPNDNEEKISSELYNSSLPPPPQIKSGEHKGILQSLKSAFRKK